MYRNNIIEALLTATLLVVKWMKGESSLQEFVNEYGSFYHYEALDGHEASSEQKKILDELQGFIELHEKIQNTVVDAVYFGGEADKKQIEELDRVTVDEAEKRLNDLCYKYDAEGLINKLGG